MVSTYTLPYGCQQIDDTQLTVWKRWIKSLIWSNVYSLCMFWIPCCGLINTEKGTSVLTDLCWLFRKNECGRKQKDWLVATDHWHRVVLLNQVMLCLLFINKHWIFQVHLSAPGARCWSFKRQTTRVPFLIQKKLLKQTRNGIPPIRTQIVSYFIWKQNKEIDTLARESHLSEICLSPVSKGLSPWDQIFSFLDLVFVNGDFIYKTILGNHMSHAP